jgi:protein-histidine N-methyltransferase
LNTVLTVQEPASSSSTTALDEERQEEQEDSDSEVDSEDEEDEGEEKRIEEDVDTCDAEAEISSENIPTMLQQLSSRTRAFVGDWSSLPVSFWSAPGYVGQKRN